MAELAKQITAAGRYAKLKRDREPFLSRARECAALTIPAVMPPEGFGKSSKLPTPYQSLGARGVRTLASKLLLSLFPAAVPFFNYRIDDSVLEKTGSKRGDFESALAKRERAVASELNLSVFRPAAFTAITQLLVAGNVMMYIPKDTNSRAQAYRLDQYVTRRDAAGNLLEFIIQESLDFFSLPIEVADVVRAQYATSGETVDLEDKPVDLYTHGYYDAESARWTVYQEAGGMRIDSTETTYKPGELEYLALRLSIQPSEDYGRGYVEELLGDLDSLEALSEALVEGSSAAARIVFLVNPSGATSLKVVAEARTGDVRSGNAADVTTLKVDKANDLQVAKAQAEEIASRLSYAFLLHAAVQRNGDRVTAEEIRFMASELDDGLGGVYTLLAADFQLPSVRLFERRAEKRLKFDKLPSDLTHPVVVTGLEAIGRGHDQANLKQFVAEILQILGPELAMRYLKPLEFMARSAAAYGIDTSGLLPTEEEVAQQEQLMQIQALAQNLGPEGLKQLGGMGNTALKAQLQPQGG